MPAPVGAGIGIGISRLARPDEVFEFGYDCTLLFRTVPYFINIYVLLCVFRNSFIIVRLLIVLIMFLCITFCYICVLFRIIK